MFLFYHQITSHKLIEFWVQSIWYQYFVWSKKYDLISLAAWQFRKHACSQQSAHEMHKSIPNSIQQPTIMFLQIDKLSINVEKASSIGTDAEIYVDVNLVNFVGPSENH